MSAKVWVSPDFLTPPLVHWFSVLSNISYGGAKISLRWQSNYNVILWVYYSSSFTPPAEAAPHTLYSCSYTMASLYTMYTLTLLGDYFYDYFFFGNLDLCSLTKSIYIIMLKKFLNISLLWEIDPEWCSDSQLFGGIICINNGLSIERLILHKISSL